jgi:hypothetical protein
MPSAYASYTPAPSACVVNAVSGGQVSVYLPVYPLKLTVSGSPSTLSAKEVAGNAYTMALNLTSGGTVSQTSLPLGEYQLFDFNGAITPAYYVWVTPAGECRAATAPTATTTPPAPAACNGATLAVVGS